MRCRETDSQVFTFLHPGRDQLPSDIDELNSLDQTVLHYPSQRRLTSALNGSSSDLLPSNGLETKSHSPSAGISPKAINPSEWMSTAELLDRLSKMSDSSPASELLIVDARPLPAYLVSHLANSLSFMIPSLIMRWCRNSGGSKFQGGWAALEAFLATEGSRSSWEGVVQRGGEGKPVADGRDVVVVVLGGFQDGKKEAEGSLVLESILQALAGVETSEEPFGPGARITIRRYEGNWHNIKEDPRFKVHLREGEKSLAKTGKATHSDNLESLLGSGAVSPADNKPIGTFSMPMTAAPSQTIFPPISLPPLPPIPSSPTRKIPAHHPSMPSLRISVPEGSSMPLPSINGLNASNDDNLLKRCASI